MKSRRPSEPLVAVASSYPLSCNILSWAGSRWMQSKVLVAMPPIYTSRLKAILFKIAQFSYCPSNFLRPNSQSIECLRFISKCAVLNRNRRSAEVDCSKFERGDIKAVVRLSPTRVFNLAPRVAQPQRSCATSFWRLRNDTARDSARGAASTWSILISPQVPFRWILAASKFHGGRSTHSGIRQNSSAG
jgi:hypothetical protein